MQSARELNAEIVMNTIDEEKLLQYRKNTTVAGMYLTIWKIVDDHLRKSSQFELDQYVVSFKVKIEDIKDNLDLTRLATVSENDLLRAAKYHKALSALTGD